MLPALVLDCSVPCAVELMGLTAHLHGDNRENLDE